MDRLWAPWRLSYVTCAKAPTEQDACFICQGLAQTNDRENLIAWRRSKCVVFLNRFPYNNGHLLVAPNAHKGHLQELDADEALEIHQTTARLIEVMTELMQPDGFNVGLNLGKAAGAGLPGHLHWHLVPRYQGDTNFMAVMSDTRVIVQSLDQFWTMVTEKLNV